MVNLFVRLGMISAGVTVTGFYGTVLLNYTFEILQQFALLLVVAVGFWVGGLLFLIQFLTNQTNPVLRVIGEILSGMMMYTALFQGVLYTALVFMVVGTVGGFGDFADSADQMVYDMVFGMSYLSVLIYGSTGIVIAVTYYRPRTRILGIALGLINTGITLFFLLFQADVLQELATSNLTLFTSASVIYLLIWSVIFMSIMAQVEDPLYEKKAKLKQRLKDRQREQKD